MASSDIIPRSERAQAISADLGHPDTNLLPVYLLRFDRPHTRRSYVNDLEAFFGTDHITLEMARNVTFVDLNQFLESMQRDGFRPATIQRRVSGLRGFFDWLVALGLIQANPAHRQVLRRVSGNRKGSGGLTVLTKDQARELIDAAYDHPTTGIRNGAMVLTMLYGALRRSEVAGMNFEDIRKLGEFWVLDLPVTKGGADQFVKLPPPVVEALFDCCNEYQIDSGPVWRSMSHNSFGKRLSERSVYTIVEQSAKKAGLYQSIGAHTLRHTACTLAIEGGASPQQVQTHARHKKLDTTMIYVHQRDKLKDNASDYIEL